MATKNRQLSDALKVVSFVTSNSTLMVSNVTITTGGTLVFGDGTTQNTASSGAGGGGAGLSSRATLSGTTSSIVTGANNNITITGYKSYALFKIGTSANAWVRIYTDQASRTTDLPRANTTDPTANSGVVVEVITTGNQTILLSPAVVGFNNEAPNTDIYLNVTNYSGTTQAITVTLTAIKLEA
jgi:hypothetical protein